MQFFLKYCPYKRDICFHALARNMSARPHDILNLKFTDIRFNLTDKGIHYAEVRITQGKTGPRTVPLNEDPDIKYIGFRND